MARKKIKVRPPVKTISFKLKDDNTEYCIYGINKDVTYKDLVDIVFENYPDFSGWMYIGYAKYKFKNSKLHSSHNSPAIRSNRNLRIFIENGILQTYRNHNGIISELINFTMTAHEEKNVSIYDIFDADGKIDYDLFLMKYFNHDNIPVATNETLGNFYCFDGYNKLVSDYEVMCFKEKNNIDSLTKSDIEVLMFEVAMERGKF